MLPPATSARDLLRHTLATVAYRGAKVLRDAPDSFADFHSSETTRTPLQILAHLGDLFDWALSMAKGQPAWHDSNPLPWHDETQRFFATYKNSTIISPVTPPSTPRPKNSSKVPSPTP